ncbi:fungal-specific transcription factor domain-containing protein [Lentinula edodes]|uniref:fungal-specific transcription factor domain-containing protein n=1 Tax=Lentinula edodes TaxID=5353 RepID=UPI001E8D68BA|nr:fungal-specific transcription factor domain-containing protein [Lentinula edodes]KAH7873029.1 fungal-specific transcription factor domain-containing protein [Lentinula edodes]KAJ3901392.1 fungal-specific transcription factor domain-containing protein [Lentinula edodes]
MASADNNRSVSPLVQRTKRRGTALSCAECRRLKLKCSRVFPCGNCVKKGCGAICPDGSLTTGKGNRFVLANTEDLHDKISQLATRVRQLEDALAHSHSISSSQPHPLLSDDLLQIKRPLERERADGAQPKEKKPDTNDTIDAMGSLSISERGRSTFFGQTANSWYLLRNEQGSDEEEKSPGSDLSIPSDVPWLSYAFPLTPTSLNKDAVRNNIITLLPDPSSAQRLCELYYRHAAWMYTPVSKNEFFEMVYRPIYNTETGFPIIGSHYLAIMYMVLAIGTLLDIDRPSHSQEATQYYELGRAALAVDSVFEEQSIPAIQALLLMCHYMFLDDIEGPRWATMGIVVKLAQSVGLHRDSGKWNLNSDETLRRRCLLWEIFTYDSWQSLTYGRPPSFALAHIDTEKPFGKSKNVHGEVEMSFAAWKHLFCSECLSVVMEQAFGARPPSYKIIQDMDKKVRSYYVPPSLQIPGFGKTPIGRELEQQPSIQLIMQRYIAFAIREITLFYLHRGFFARALEDSPIDPMGSKYAPSVLAAYTSACSFVSLIDSMFRQYPVLTERMWFLFTHVFSCSIVLGSIACKVQIAIAPSALSHLDTAHKLFLSTTENPRREKVLPILHRLKERAHAVLTGSATPGSPLSSGSPPVKSEEDELAALGGMTRLVPRKPSSAPSTPSYAGSSPKSDPASPSPIQSTIPEQSPYHSPDQTTAWQYPLPSHEYTEHSQYPHYSPEADTSMRYNEPQLQHGISPMNGMTDPYFGGYSSSQYYRPDFDNAFQNGLRNAGDFNLPVETGDSWHNLVASQYKPI